MFYLDGTGSSAFLMNALALGLIIGNRVR